jgi:hypothetical protein
MNRDIEGFNTQITIQIVRSPVIHIHLEAAFLQLCLCSFARSPPFVKMELFLRDWRVLFAHN